LAGALALGLCAVLCPTLARSEEMDQMWGDSVVTLRAEDARRGQLFAEGNYAMFIHWGLYSSLGNEVNGKTYYGIGEWIMNNRMAGIPVPEYKELARQFNPVKFDAKAIARLARDAGMKYIIITSKHHDGFAMFGSKADPFNIVDATPYRRDPMKELADACREVGIGFGFYYSHNQDWTFPGGNGGPQTDAQGKPATFDDYFRKKCLPQVEEITSGYGPIEIVWFDTPGKMPQDHVEKLIEVVRRNQPRAIVSGRAGHGLGDYQSLGDMEIPVGNIDGLWETVDTTNDSWAYAGYDENWKSPQEILHRLISCVARGGTYMLNIGPRGDGSVPARAAQALRVSGEWLHHHSEVIYGAGPSPWGHALPWGDVTVRDHKLLLSVFQWPAGGKLHVPGLKTTIRSANLLRDGKPDPVAHSREHGWTVLSLPPQAPDLLVSVVEVELDGPPEVDRTFGIDPAAATELDAHFATASGAKLNSKRWMEKFGEWKHAMEVTAWEAGGTVDWEVDVLLPGEYQVALTYSGEGRLVWGVSVEGGQSIRNQQNSSHNYQSFPIGWLEFSKPGRHRVKVSCLEGNMATASLKAIRFTPVGRLPAAVDTAKAE
jgi:alpha-L-fucosidase